MPWWMSCWALIAVCLVAIVGWRHDRERQRGGRPSRKNTAFWFAIALIWPLPAAILILGMALDFVSYLIGRLVNRLVRVPH